MKTTQHTLGLPLKLVYLSNAWEIREANGSLLFHIPAGRQDEEAEANAQFIVTACNNYYELLEACRIALADESTSSKVAKVCYAAIANAGALTPISAQEKE